MWKEHLAMLEHAKRWDEAIGFMQQIVKQNPDSLDAYLSICYLLMNLLVEEEYDHSKRDYYACLAQCYFEESYKKFSDSAEYLYYIGRIAVMSEWYFGIQLEDADRMIQEASILEPYNPIFHWNHYTGLAKDYAKNKEVILKYCNEILKKDSTIEMKLKGKGALGEYILGMMQHWAQRMLRGNKW